MTKYPARSYFYFLLLKLYSLAVGFRLILWWNIQHVLCGETFIIYVRNIIICCIIQTVQICAFTVSSCQIEQLIVFLAPYLSFFSFLALVPSQTMETRSKAVAEFEQSK